MSEAVVVLERPDLGSGVGTTALQLSSDLGARTIGSFGTGDKVQTALDVGLHGGIVADGASLWVDAPSGRPQAVAGVEVILDHVGGEHF